jgi:hypothetical protein
MSRTLTLQGEVRADHVLTVLVPDEVPVGPTEITLKIDGTEEPIKMIRTFGDLLESGFVGMFADRDDLPRSTEQFSAWRKRLWEDGPDDATGH